MPTPTTKRYDHPVPVPDIASRYPRGDGDRYDRLAAAWALVFYALFVCYLVELVPAWLFGVVGVCAFVRNFNALHEGFHARRATGRWRLARHLFVVTSPFMLGYHPLRRNHHEHHAWAQQPERDPDAYLAYGPWWRALFHAITQPEQGFVRYLRRHGPSPELIGRLLLHTAVMLGLAVASVRVLGHLGGLVAWIAVTRVGNTASWFIFDWILHQPWAWGRFAAPGIPRAVRRVWAVLFGEDNLFGVEHHFVHHQYHFVPGTALPRLAEELRSHA